MRSIPRTSTTGPPRAASRHDAGTVSPAALRIAHEADATMSPDGWEANYAQPQPRAEALAPRPFLFPAGALPTA
jgi:hypothetical protein